MTDTNYDDKAFRQTPPPIQIDDPLYKPSERLRGQVAIITGADSGIGASTAIAFAKEGARVVIAYYNEDVDAQHVAEIITALNIDPPLCIRCDIRDQEQCAKLVTATIDAYGDVNIVVNNAGTQTLQAEIENISTQQLQETFATNIFGMFYLTQAALTHMKRGDSIINTASITAYRGHTELLDYSASKGAIVSFTRSLSQNLADEGIRVNAVAPGPVWTPLILDSMSDEHIQSFGKQQPLGRAAQPNEIAPAYVFLASRDARYITGQVVHVNGGEIVNG